MPNPLIDGPCVVCGHTGADHSEGDVGAAVNDDAYCHVADHSCYIPAEHPIGNGDVWRFIGGRWGGTE